MLEPLTALSIAGTVVQFVDFSCKIFSNAYEMHQSASGGTVVNQQLETYTSRLSDQLTKLSRPLSVSGLIGCMTEEEAELHALCKDCHTIGKKLHQKLAKLKHEGKRNPWESLSKAIKAAWNKNEIEGLVTRLKDFKSVLELNIMRGLRQSMDLMILQQSDRFGGLDAEIQNIITALFEQRGSADELSMQMLTIAQMLDRMEIVAKEHQNKSLEAHFDADKTRSRLADLRRLEEKRIQKVQTRILESLRTVNQEDRQETIALAHQRTFGWIFEEDNSISTNWSNFVQWLNDDAGIYWITGKPGSGKSTLMKFIYESPRTTSELGNWAGNTPLLTSAFFFWNSGTKEQRSQTGFLKALLFDILHKERGLISICFPSLWAHYYSDQANDSDDLWSDRMFPQLSLQKLIAAFDNLLTQKLLSFRLCLFIDGLDEFDGDHTDLVKFIARCSASSFVKVCASSRPHLVFEDYFETKPHLRLQDLTGKDIQTYVTSMLKESPRLAKLALKDPTAAENLISEVVDVADGVFLWVRLATQSLINGVHNHDTISDLRRRLKQMPTELMDLYEHILNSIDPFYRVQSAELFLLLHASEHRYIYKNIDSPLSALDLYLVIEESSDSGCYTLEAVTDYLKTRCAGLIEVQEGDSTDHIIVFADRPTVHYIHWTAREYLESRIVVERHREMTQGGSFNANISYLKCCVSMQGWDLDDLEWDYIWQRIFTIMWHAYEADVVNDRRYISLIDSLNERVTEIYEGEWSPDAVSDEVWMLESHWAMLEDYSQTGNLSRVEDPGFDFLSFAVRFGLSSYVKQKLSEGHTKKGTPLLAYTIFPATPSQRYKVSPEVVAVLFQYGADPNETYMGQSFWEYFLETIYHYPETTDRNTVLKLIAICELFLKYGAYCNQRVVIRRNKLTALAIIMETLMKWAPLEAADLHKMLLGGGASLDSTFLQKQSDLVEVVANAATYGLRVGKAATRSAGAFAVDLIHVGPNRVRRRIQRRAQRALNIYMGQEELRAI